MTKSFQPSETQGAEPSLCGELLGGRYMLVRIGIRRQDLHAIAVKQSLQLFAEPTQWQRQPCKRPCFRHIASV